MTDSEQLYQLVQSKMERLEQLHSCSNHQMQYVETGNMEAILEILAAKQRLLLDIESIDRRIAQHHVDDPEERVWPSPKMRTQCREMIARCDLLIRETLEQDRQSEQCLSVKKDVAKQQLMQLADKSQIHNAYRQQKSFDAERGHLRTDLGTR